MVTVKVIDRHFADEKTDVDLSFFQYLKLKMNQSVCIGKKTKHGWSGELPFFITTCENHGYFIDYPHGWNKTFECPECQDMVLSAKDLAPILSDKTITVPNPLPQTSICMPSKK